MLNDTNYDHKYTQTKTYTHKHTCKHTHVCIPKLNYKLVVRFKRMQWRWYCTKIRWNGLGSEKGGPQSVYTRGKKDAGRHNNCL